MTKINAKGSEIFRNALAVELYDRMRNDSDVFECGVDNNGNIYFAYLNGNVKRYTRREFVNLAREEKEFD